MDGFVVPRDAHFIRVFCLRNGAAVHYGNSVNDGNPAQIRTVTLLICYALSGQLLPHTCSKEFFRPELDSNPSLFGLFFQLVDEINSEPLMAATLGWR